MNTLIMVLVGIVFLLILNVVFVTIKVYQLDKYNKVLTKMVKDNCYTLNFCSSNWVANHHRCTDKLNNLSNELYNHLNKRHFYREANGKFHKEINDYNSDIGTPKQIK